jgi:hypothetical protein
MEEILGDNKVNITVDEALPIDSGGYGTIFAVQGTPGVVVKRLDVDPPRPLDSIREYTAHITVTRDRLQAIIDEEAIQPEPRTFIIEYITKILAFSLSTHWACDVAALQITAVWLLQRRAPGKSLKQHFADTIQPTSWTRKRIAREFVTRMRTLRRADLVHLDCVHENVIYDEMPFQVTAIDLDGCGIVRRQRSGRVRSAKMHLADEWEYPPVTLGHTKLVRLPPWYPQPGLHAGPRRGNYLFAERWVVLDTIIRILTWGKMSALSWLEDSQARTELGRAYRKLTIDLQAFTSANDDASAAVTWWTAAWQEKARELGVEFKPQIRTPLPDYWKSRGHPDCLTFFADLAEQAYFDPQALSAPIDTTPLYEIFSRQLG